MTPIEVPVDVVFHAGRRGMIRVPGTMWKVQCSKCPVICLVNTVKPDHLCCQCYGDSLRRLLRR